MQMPANCRILQGVLVLTVGFAPARAFMAGAPAPALLSRSSRGLARSVMQMSPSETNSEDIALGLSRRSFFASTAGSAMTVGALGFEVPQAYAKDVLPAVNAPAPVFELPSNAGKTVSLNDLKGKWAVLYFYPGDFTSGCTIEAQNFEKNADVIRKLGAEIYGVSVDSVDKHLDFSKKYNLSFTLLSDQGGKISQAYGSALSIPLMGTFSNRQTYLISPTGELKWVFTDVQSRLNKHADEVISKLKELTA